MMKHLSLFLVTLFFFISCTNKPVNTTMSVDLEVIQVDFEKEYKKRRFPQTNASMTVYKKLAENSEFPIGYIDKVLVDDERIYFLDRSKAKAVFIFSREGRFIHIINNAGSGPGEFVAPQCFDIDRKNGNIVIMDSQGKKMIIYSSDGEYIKEFGYDFIAVDFILDQENNLIFNTGNFPSDSNENFLLVKTDMDGRVLDRFFPSDNLSPSLSAFNPRNSLQECGGELFFLPTFSNMIYVLNNGSPQPVYQIDFGKSWPTDEFIQKSDGMHPLKVREEFLKNEYVCFLNFIQTKDVLHIDFHKGKNYSFYYNKNTKQSLLLPMEDESISFPVGVCNNQFIFVSYKETGEPRLVFYDVDFDR